MSKDKKVVKMAGESKVENKKAIGKKFNIQELEFVMNTLSEIPYKFSANLIQFLAQQGEVLFGEDGKDGKDNS